MFSRYWYIHDFSKIFIGFLFTYLKTKKIKVMVGVNTEHIVCKVILVNCLKTFTTILHYHNKPRSDPRDQLNCRL